MAERFWLSIAALVAVMSAHAALAQDQELALTPAGKAILQSKIARSDQPPNDLLGAPKPVTFPLPMCAFPGGLCGAVRRDGAVAVPPRYDWVGPFSDNRAAVRLGGLYGFVDEAGHEIVKPQYRIIDDYKFGFAQVDVNGKSGLIDRDGKMAIEPRYGFIEAIGPGRFRVFEHRRLGGKIGSEDFSDLRTGFLAAGGDAVSGFRVGLDFAGAGVIDIAGQWIDPPSTSRAFDKDDPSIRLVQRDLLWGLARADGSWLVEPKFQQADPLSDGLARVKVNGKVGFIDRTGNFAIEPVFDQAPGFALGFAQSSAERDGVVGVIDKSGSWIFQTSYQQIFAATARGKDRSVLGWNVKNAGRWGLLDLDGLTLLEADFDQPIHHCADGRLEAYKNKEWLYFKGDGTPLQPPDGRLVDASCFGGVPPYTLKIGDQLGLVDADSSQLTPVHFDAVVWAGPGAKNVKIDGKLGRVGRDGRWLLEPRFDYLSAGIDIFVASIDGKRGFMRADGTWLIEPKFDAARRRADDTAFVTVSGATGVLRLMDQSWVVPPRPGAMCGIPDAIMWQADGARAILSPIGETWIDIGAERITIDLEVGLLTFLKNGKWGLVDTAGQVTIEPQFDEPVLFASRGVVWAKRGDHWSAIDRRGRPVPGIASAAANPMGGPMNRFDCKVGP